jgi:CBS domain-containing protein
VMSTDVTTVRTSTPFKDIARLLDSRNISAAPVLDTQDRVVGVVSQADLLPKQGAQEPPEPRTPLSRLRRRRDRNRTRATTAGELMTTPAHTIGPEATVVDAARLLDRHAVKRLPVVDDAGNLLGIVSRRDLLSVFLRNDADIADEIVHEVFERNLGITVNPATVTVEVRDGVVTLRGELERKSMISIAETLTSRVDGVVDVHAHLRFAYDDTHIHIRDELTAAVDPAAEPPWIYWWSDSEAHGNAGRVAVLLGRPHEAETHFRHALADGDCLPHFRALSLCGLAMARVQARELDGACRAATEAATLGRRLDSERVRGQLVEFRRAIQPHAAATPVKDFDAKFANLLRTAATAH